MFHHILLQAPAAAVDTMKQAATGIVSPTGATTPTEDVTSPLELIMLGGWVMIPLILFLLLTFYFAVERLVVISKASKVDRNFMHNIRDYLLSGKIDSARELCRTQNTPVARVIEKGISRLGKQVREVSDAMQTTGQLEIARTEKHLHILSLIARIAPMLGFIGTVAGVITIFMDISHSGDISIKSITGGLYEKMFASGAGLIVGVIAFSCYHMLNSMVDKLAHTIERNSLEFLDLLNEPAK
jgi:biopolymer transport protein ExbB